MSHEMQNEVRPTVSDVRINLGSENFQVSRLPGLRDISAANPYYSGATLEIIGNAPTAHDTNHLSAERGHHNAKPQHHYYYHHKPEHHSASHGYGHATAHGAEHHTAHSASHHASHPLHHAEAHHERSRERSPEIHRLAEAAREVATRNFTSERTTPAAWTERVLNETVSALDGKSPQMLEAGLDPRLGCARCVTQFGHRAYGLPITDSVANLESSMQARNFTRVPMNAETMAHLQPGDIIVGHRNGRLNGEPLHGHTAVYMGDGKVFNNNAVTRTMIPESLSIFQQPLYDRNGRMHMNGYSDVWIYRPRASAA